MEQDAEEDETPTGVEPLGPSTSETPPLRPRYRTTLDSGASGSQEYLSPEELVEHAGQGAIAHSEILNKQITPEEAANPEALEEKRKEIQITTTRCCWLF
jgi:hypothetical protein